MIPESALSTDPYLQGINIGNALEAPKPGLWGVTIQKSYLHSIADAGFNGVRIPARFSGHTGEPPAFPIDQTFLETVDKTILWGLDEGLVVILDLHGFTELMEDPVANESQFLKIWEQLSKHYQSYPDRLWFELINEPSGNLVADRWNDLVDKSLQTIRQTNPQRKVLVGGVNYSTVDSLFLLDLPQDPHLIGVFHFYAPFEFTHQGAGWVESSANWLGTTWTGTETQKDAVRKALDRAVFWSHQSQIPILMGEYGVIKKADAKSRRRWISFVASEAEKRRIGWLYWSFCSNFGIYDCEESTWNQKIIEEILQP